MVNIHVRHWLSSTFGPKLVCLFNNIFLEYNHAHSFIYCPSLFQDMMTQVNLCYRHDKASRIKNIYYLTLSKKSLLSPDLRIKTEYKLMTVTGKSNYEIHRSLLVPLRLTICFKYHRLDKAFNTHKQIGK